jgi:hypothetical protein
MLMLLLYLQPRAKSYFLPLLFHFLKHTKKYSGACQNSQIYVMGMYSSSTAHASLDSWDATEFGFLDHTFLKQPYHEQDLKLLGRSTI